MSDTWNGAVAKKDRQVAIVNVPIAASTINSAPVVYVWPVPFDEPPVTTCNSVRNSVLAARILEVTAEDVTLQSYWSDQGAGHSAVPALPVHVIAYAP